jgi:hypothetical protein
VWPPLIAGSALHPDSIPHYIFLLKTTYLVEFLLMFQK